MNPEFFINEPFDASLKAMFEAIFASGSEIINCAASKVAMRIQKRVHLGMNCKLIFHRAFV